MMKQKKMNKVSERFLSELIDQLFSTFSIFVAIDV